MINEAEYRKYIRRLEGYSYRVKQLYIDAIDELIKLYKRVDFNPDKPFEFSKYKSVSKDQQKIIERLHENLYSLTHNGMTKEWNTWNKLIDKAIASFVGNQLSADYAKPFYVVNNKALKDMQDAAGPDNMNMSKKVWNYADQFTKEAEYAFDVALREGHSANRLSRDMRQYLDEPEKLFRRVRDAQGNLQLSKRAKEYHPGQGVYRSSYKNAMRFAVTQINMAHHESDWQRRQNLPFVIGYEIRRSEDNPYECEVCEKLKGIYPKIFKFLGWHPWCKCWTISILMSAKERLRLFKWMKEGKDPKDFKSDEMITELPDGMKEWISENNKRIVGYKTKPYFVRDNFKLNKDNLTFKNIAPYVPDEEEMKKAGFYVYGKGDVSKEYNKVMKGFNLKEFDDDITRISKKYGIKITDKDISAYNNEVIIKYSGDNDFRIVRTFTPGKVYHDNMTLPENVQGQGASKELIRAMYRQYKNADIKEINIVANITIGGYAWARYGFSAKAESYSDLVSWAKWQLSEKVISQNDYKDFSIWMKQYKEKAIPMYDLVKKPYAKRLLIDSNWNGFLNLTDKKTVDIFEDYISG